MSPLAHLFASALLAATATAHFELLTPPPIHELDENQESSAPCGGFTPSFSGQLSDFHVGGDAVAVSSGHSQGTWIVRATLDETASGNWTQLYPIWFQDGVGKFCQPAIPAPKEFVGKKGVISIVDNAPDGLLYQCAAVNFVDGTGPQNSACTNNSVVKLSFTNDPALSALVGNGSSGSTPTTSGTPSSSSSPSSTPNAGLSLHRDFAGSSVAGNLLAVAGLAVFGAALLY